MLSYSAVSAADPQATWALVASPERWPEWAPHVRGGWHLGSPEVKEGSIGAIRLFVAVPVPAKITKVDPGHSWEWRVGLVAMDHIVEPVDGGSRVTVTISAPGPLEAAVARTYGPVLGRLVERLARIAGDGGADG